MVGEMPPREIVVLLVDDQAIVGETVRYMLADQADIRYHYCARAASALELVAELRPTVILQDLMMPDGDGLQLLARYRATPASADVPVIVLSSKEQPAEKSQAFSQGATDYLVKIPDKIELVARVRAHSRSYLAQRERDEAYRALDELRKKLEESNAALERLSNHDGLTGLANRRHFDEVMLREWRRSARAESPLSLILMDVDHFKRFNDTHGHLLGDDCLRRVAACLKRSLWRITDLGARYGGEEFVALLPETPNAGAVHVATRLRVEVASEKIPHGHPEAGPQVTLSMGVATVVPRPAEPPARLVAMADEALYSAKRGGRDRHQVHPASLT
jgi:two-component system chemotaxis family response regulator WspR